MARIPKHLNTYTLYALGPDDSSTYAECWGAHATSDGHEVVTGSWERVETALSQLGHDNVSILLHARQGVRSRCLDASEFRKLNN